jgi:hypothetical protein
MSELSVAFKSFPPLDIDISGRQMIFTDGVKKLDPESHLPLHPGVFIEFMS